MRILSWVEGKTRGRRSRGGGGGEIFLGARRDQNLTGGIPNQEKEKRSGPDAPGLEWGPTVSSRPLDEETILYLREEGKQSSPGLVSSFILGEGTIAKAKRKEEEGETLCVRGRHCVSSARSIALSVGRKGKKHPWVEESQKKGGGWKKKK